MPAIIDPYHKANMRDLSSMAGKYPYSYPKLSDGTVLDLKPGSDLSKKILTEILSRAQVSRERVGTREATWTELDDATNVYIRHDTAELAIKTKDDRAPIPIVVPVLAAVVETIVTYILAAVGGPPAFRYQGSGPEDAVGALLLERYIEWQFNRYKHILALLTQWRDSIVYGFGVVTPIWTTKIGYVDKQVEDPIIDYSSGTVMGMNTTTQTVRSIISEGHQLKSIDPRNFLWDPNVCEYDLQNGEYAGFITRTNYPSALSWERDSGEAVYNCKYLKHIDGKSMLTSTAASSRTGENTYPEVSQSDTTKPIDIIHMYINLVPKEWGLSSWEYPQKWYFAIAGDSLVLSASPLEYKHDMFPISVCAPGFDGHSGLSLSRAEMIYPMQHHLNWFINSLVEASAKDLGGTTVYDPAIINEPDLLKKGPVKLVRIRKPYWTKDCRTSIFNLESSISQARNLTEASYMMDMIQRASGASDALQGMRREGGERVTATEIQGIKGGALGRMQLIARIIGAQSIQDLAFMLASQSAQRMTREFYASIIGRGEEVLRAEYGVEQYAKVSPADIDVDVDIVPIDGTIASGDNVQGWGEFAKTLIADPMVMQELRMRWDVIRVLKHTFREMGMKDVSEFERHGGPAVDMQVMPTEQVMDQASSGQLIPLKGLGNAGA